MVSCGNHMYAHFEEFSNKGFGKTEASGYVFTVGDYKV